MDEMNLTAYKLKLWKQSREAWRRRNPPRKGIVAENVHLVCECECGRTWDMDYSPTPDGCEGAVWRLWANGEPGTWVSDEGNPATPVGHEDFPPQCNGICLTGADVGVPYAGIAYAHPDCDLHGVDRFNWRDDQ